MPLSPSATATVRNMSAGERPLLTAEQLEVLQALALGLRTSSAVARHMGVSPVTIRKRLERARERLGAESTYEAIAICAAIGLVEVRHGQDARMIQAQRHMQMAVRLLQPLDIVS